MVGPYPVTKTPDGKKGPKDYSQYSKLLADFIRDVRKEFKAPRMPFVIGVGGNPDKPNAFRDAMAAPAALPEFKGNVVAVHTAQYWDHKLDELLNRLKKVTSNKKTSGEDQYADLRKKLSPLLKEYKEIEALLKPLDKKLSDVRKKKVTLPPEELKETRALKRKHTQRRKDLESKLTTAMFTEEEIKIQTVGRSNQAYHYYGSSKILGLIGEACANAMAKLNGNKTDKK